MSNSLFFNKNNNKSNLLLLLLFIIQFVSVKFLSNNKLFINKVYPDFFLDLNLLQRKLFHIVPFDIGNILYVLIFLIFCFCLIKSIKSKKIIHTFLIFINIFFFIFYLFWGFNYYNNTIEKKYFTNQISNKQLIKLTEYFYNKTIIYSQYSERDLNQNFIIYNKKKIYSKIIDAQTKTKLISEKVINKINTKPSIFSHYFSYIGIGGVYNPFTAEAIYNQSMPDIKLPFTISHEMAHQLGFASETEANFIGFLVGTNLNNNSFKYAIYYTALKYAMFCLFERAPVLYPFYLSRFNDKMIKDFEQEKEYFNKYSSEAETYFSYSNDMFLKLNNQKEGINSYNKFIYMLINYYRF